MELDFADVLLDPDITDLFTVTRREQLVSSAGRGSVTPTVFANIVGVVCAAHGNDLDRLDDADRIGNNISIVTKFMLRGPSTEGGKTYKPDLVTWKGSDYQVKLVEPYGHVGSGFVQAIAGSNEIVEAAPSA